MTRALLAGFVFGFALPSAVWAQQVPASQRNEPIPRIEAGAGMGFGSVGLSYPTRSIGSPALDARVGFRVRERLSAGALFGVYGFNDDTPLDTDAHYVGPYFVHDRNPRVAQTRAILGFVQWTHPTGFLIRGAAGFARNHYAAYYANPGEPIRAIESGEMGLSLALAAGKQWRLTKRIGLGVEGFALWSGGEDSETGRHVLGVMVVPTLR